MRITPVFTVLFLVSAATADARAALPETIPIEFENNTVYVAAAINSGPPRWFILDSGASGCVVDAALAQQLSLAVHGEAKGTGAGQGSYTLRFVDGISYTVGAQNFAVPRSYIIDLSGQRTLMGREVAGILGYEFFDRHVVSLDFDARKMRLLDPASPPHANGASAIPIKLVKKTPYIDAQIAVADGRAETHDYLVDSGSGDAISDDAINTAPRRVEIVAGVGLGQEFRSTLGRAASFTLAGFKLKEPIVGAGGKRLIGNEILRRFDVTFDYRRLRLLLKPNMHISEPFVFDASGLDLRWTDDLTHLRIHDVAQASPAAEADLRTGDLITALNGKPARSYRMEAALALLRQAGAVARLTILRDGKTRSVELRLRARI